MGVREGLAAAGLGNLVGEELTRACIATLGGGRPCLVVDDSERLYSILIGDEVSLDTLPIAGTFAEVLTFY